MRDIGEQIPEEQVPFIPDSQNKVWTYSSEPQKRNKYNEDAFPYNQEWINEWQKQTGKTGMTRFLQEIVEKEPKSFIAEEEIPACIELWKKNIYTRMSGLPYEDGNSWIEIFFEQLSDENKKIAKRIADTKSRGKNRCVLRTEHVGKDGQTELLEIARMFKMQEPPCSLEFNVDEDCNILICSGAYITIEQFLELIKNYSHMSIVTNDIEQTVQEFGAIYDEETKRVYRSQFDYDKYKNYLEYLKGNVDGKSNNNETTTIATVPSTIKRIITSLKYIFTIHRNKTTEYQTNDFSKQDHDAKNKRRKNPWIVDKSYSQVKKDKGSTPFKTNTYDKEER